ncbi:MAG: hypothetical protein ACLP0J_24435 [Solirubrobacteraceae bacterium]|jgi:hypothetical protein
MVNPAYREWFRLMLIHYPEEGVPTRWVRDVWEEDRTAHADIQQSDVEDYLRDWAAVQGQLFPAVEHRAAELLVLVDGPAADPAVPRVRRISDTLAALRRQRP